MKKSLLFGCVVSSLFSLNGYGMNFFDRYSNADEVAEENEVEINLCEDKTLIPGKTTREITVNGEVRSYILNIPESYSGNSETPLVLDFHGLMLNGRIHSRSSGTLELSEEAGFIVAFPNGVNSAWNFGPCCTRSREVDDEAFARAIVADIKENACVEEKRVYAMGYSNGGGISHFLACEASDVFAAVAPAAFDLVVGNQCDPARPISVYLKRGPEDQIVPYAGGDSTPPTLYPLDPITFLGAEETFAEWGRLNQCSGAAKAVSETCQAFSQCADDVDVVLCTEGRHETWDAQQAWDYLKDNQLPQK